MPIDSNTIDPNAYEAGVKLLQLWALEYHMLETIFEEDENVRVYYDPKTHVCTLYCSDAARAAALDKIISTSELEVKVAVEDYGTKAQPKITNEEIHTLFDGNPYFNCLSSEGIILMSPEAAWYYSDDRFSPNGKTAILPADLFKAVFSFGRPVKTDPYNT